MLQITVVSRKSLLASEFLSFSVFMAWLCIMQHGSLIGTYCYNTAVWSSSLSLHLDTVISEFFKSFTLVLSEYPSVIFICNCFVCIYLCLHFCHPLALSCLLSFAMQVAIGRWLIVIDDTITDPLSVIFSYLTRYLGVELECNGTIHQLFVDFRKTLCSSLIKFGMSEFIGMYPVIKCI